MLLSFRLQLDFRVETDKCNGVNQNSVICHDESYLDYNRKRGQKKKGTFYFYFTQVILIN